MGCNNTAISRRRPVWTDGQDTYALFLPFYRTRVNRVAATKMSLLVEGGTSSLIVAGAVRYSDDGVTWGTASELAGVGSVDTSASWQYGSSYLSPDASRQWVEYGVLTKNGTPGTKQMGQVTIGLELRSGVIERAGFASVTVATYSSTASASVVSVFDEDSYGTYDYTENVTAEGITYASTTGNFTFAETGTYKIEATLLLEASGSTVVETSLYRSGTVIYAARPRVNNQADPVERTMAVIVEVTAGQYVYCTVESQSAETVTVKPGTTLNITRLK